ncbi:MAG: carbohydrate binding domain-containing protein [Roseburia sp.]|nr:carbohydrate binding domain-containing protein [Roseburia sp.]
MRRIKNKAVRALAVMMAATMVFTSLPMSGLGTVTVLAENVSEETMGENLLKNADFSEGSANWGTNYNASTFSFDDGKAVLNANGLGDDWMPGLFQEGIVLKAGSKYRISFDIESSINRSVTVGFDAPRMAMQDVELTAGESKHVSYDTDILAENQASTNQKYYFYLGMFQHVTDYPDAHTITIDNVSICEIMEGTSGTEDEDVTDNNEGTTDENTGDNSGNEEVAVEGALVFENLNTTTYRSQDDGSWAGDSNVTFTYEGTTATISADSFGWNAWGVQWAIKDLTSTSDSNVFAFDVVSTIDKSFNYKNENTGEMETITLTAGETVHIERDVTGTTFSTTFDLTGGGAGSVTFSNMTFEPKAVSEPTDPTPTPEPEEPEEEDKEEVAENALDLSQLKTEFYRAQDDGNWAGDVNAKVTYNGTEAVISADSFGWNAWGIQWKLLELKSENEENTFTFDVVSTIDKNIVYKNETTGVAETIVLKANEKQHLEYAAPGKDLNVTFDLVGGEGAGSVTFSNVTFGTMTTSDVVDPEPTPDEGEKDDSTEPGEPQYPASIENGTPYTSESTKVKTTVDEENVSSNWTLQWSDEFGVEEFTNGKLTGHSTDGPGSTVEKAAWTYMIGNGSGYSGAGWGNNEEEIYTDENTSVAVGNDIDGGALVITAEKESNGEFTSTRLWTMDDGNLTKDKEALYTKQYGRVEARIKIEPTEGEDPTGLWPAFWMMPAYDEYGTWAASGELDIMEARGSNIHSVDGTIHYGSQWPNNKSIGSHYSSEDFSYTDWHTYAVEWLPGELRWYVDDICYYTTSDWYSTSNDNATEYTYPAPFDQEFYILLNVAVGGNYDAGALSDSLTEASMYVDYVRVYDLQKENGTTYTKADYEALESTVSRPTYEVADTPIAGTVGENMVDVSDLTGYKTTTNYPSEEAGVRNAQWFVSNLGSGTGKSSNTIEDGDTLVINTTTVGANDYDVQLIHNVPLTKGYTYEISFDAKADKVKTIAGKFANISGYPAYSDGLSVDLETDWNHYTYTFNMVADSDADGRIEFTVGGTTGKTYFKNFSIICKGKTTEAGADDAKEPLSNGNHIYNGTFDQGTNRTYFWGALENTTLTSAKNVNKGVVTGTSADSGIYQKGLNLLQGDSYRFSMDVSAANAGDVTVLFVSADEKTVYGSKTFNVGSAQEAVVEFTMPADVTDTNGMLKIVTGNNTVTIDNVKMIRTTSNNLAWDEVDLYPLYNGDFFNGDDGWNIWSENAGWQTHAVNGAGYMDMEYSVGENADFWCVGVQSPAIKMTAGVPYVITVDYESTIDKNIKVETPDGVQTDYDFAAGAHTKTFEFTPSKDVSGSFAMYFGNQPTGGNQHFIMRNISVEVDTAKASVPAEYQVKKPGSIASAGAVKAGKDIVINTNNAEWAKAITEVYVNGKAYDADEYITVNGTQIVIASALMDAEGSYTVKFAAEGYADAKAIAQNVLEASGNVIVNGKFATNLDGWETYFSSWNIPNGSAEVVDGEAVIHVVSTEGNNWDVQLKQAGLKLDAASYYMLSFDAYATVARPVQMEFANLGAASQTIVNLGTEKQTYYIYFTNVAATEAASVLFMGGNVNGCLGDFAAVGAHDIVIDNVTLYEATLEDIHAVVAPTVSLKDQVVFGNDIVLAYEENTVWENKAIAVTVDGRTTADKYVAVNTTANEIVIAGEVIGNAGNHTVAVTAEGYGAVDVAVNAIADSNASILPEAWATWIGEGDQGAFVELLADGFTFDFVETIYHEEWQLGMFWTAQAKKENISTVAGKTYVLSFDTNMVYDDASVTEAREIVVETNLGQQKISVPAGESHFEIEYEPGARGDFYVLLMVGGCEKGIAPHNITLSDITLTEKATGDAVQKEPVEAPVADTVKAESAEDGKVTLSWNAVDGVSTYGIYAATEADGNYVLVAETAETSYVLENLEAGTYYYAVAALAADEAHCTSELVKLSVVVEGESQPENPDDSGNEEDGKEDTDKGNTGSGTSNNNSSSVSTSQAPAEQTQPSQATQSNSVAASEDDTVTPEVEENVEDVVEEVEQTEAPEQEEAKTEIVDEETPLADAAAEEAAMPASVWMIAVVIILIGAGAAALGVVFRKKDELK